VCFYNREREKIDVQNIQDSVLKCKPMILFARDPQCTPPPTTSALHDDDKTVMFMTVRRTAARLDLPGELNIILIFFQHVWPLLTGQALRNS